MTVTEFMAEYRQEELKIMEYDLDAIKDKTDDRLQETVETLTIEDTQAITVALEHLAKMRDCERIRKVSEMIQESAYANSDGEVVGIFPMETYVKDMLTVTNGPDKAFMNFIHFGGMNAEELNVTDKVDALKERNFHVNQVFDVKEINEIYNKYHRTEDYTMGEVMTVVEKYEEKAKELGIDLDKNVTYEVESYMASLYKEGKEPYIYVSNDGYVLGNDKGIEEATKDGLAKEGGYGSIHENATNLDETTHDSTKVGGNVRLETTNKNSTLEEETGKDENTGRNKRDEYYR